MFIGAVLPLPQKSRTVQYNRDLAEWEYQVSRKPTTSTKEQHRPPEKQSVLKHLREIQERNKQKLPQRQHKKSIDRDSR